MFDKIMENHKALIAIPIILALLSLALISFNGIEQGVELKGGSLAELQLTGSTSVNDLESQLTKELNTNNIKVTSNGENKVTVELENNVNSSTFSKAIDGKAKVISYNEIGPVLSEEAMGQIYIAMLFAFLFMAVTVFIVFREPVPSVAIILAALCDILIALGGMSILHIPLSIASVGALLMLIGYSVDTDILLTTRLLKRREGTVDERARNAMHTGLTMSCAAIAAMGILYIVTVIIMPEATTLSNISAVLVIGLIGDILSTWLMNLGILKTYIDWRQSKKQDKFNIDAPKSNESKSKSKEEDGKSESKSFKDRFKRSKDDDSKDSESEDSSKDSESKDSSNDIDSSEEEKSSGKDKKSSKKTKSNKKGNKRKTKKSKKKGKGGK
ncbi:protein export membrane protein SecF [Methanobrevibacter ruminantium M1]|uniref:Protein-export membrane protein SecF n=1 Tax=Methanobrevibacter ruminantium (strain ATCC 35063 / DSM 1093 / JCM 13430 / OCM 146 / M1) TaxID=634498 RepID=D3DZ21_METRM|nr:protein export membrane protein SecF [Methanobrevibacter ruminantium M1]